MVTTLREELLTASYNSMTPEQMLVIINSDTVSTGIRQLVPLWQIKKLCIETGAWLMLKAASIQVDNQNLAQVASLALTYIDDVRFENLNLDLPSTQQMIIALVQGEVFSEEQTAIIDEMANAKTSRAIQLLGRKAELSDIIDAL